MNMLNQEQIQTLFDLCEKEGVKYYDVQIELVDHIAATFEAEMANNHNISFTELLNRDESRFELNEFKKDLKKKCQQIENNLKKRKYETELTFLKFPRIAFTLCCIFALWILGESIKTTDYSFSILIILCTAAIVNLGCKFYIWNHKRKITKKLLIIQAQDAISTISFMLLYILCSISNHFPNNATFFLFLIFVLGSSYYIIFSVSNIILWNKMKIYVSKNYPEAFKTITA